MHDQPDTRYVAVDKRCAKSDGLDAMELNEDRHTKFVINYLIREITGRPTNSINNLLFVSSKFVGRYG